MENKRKIRFIVNPFSGISNKENFEQIIQDHLDHKQFEFDYFLTEAPKHACQLAQEAVDQNYAMAIAVGGDGTVNEVASSLINTNTALGVIPGGSGNGFAMYIGMGRNKKNAIKLLNSGKLVKIDSCSVNKLFFINIAGVGFDANIAFHIKKSEKRGFSLYFKTVLKEALKFNANAYQIKLDDTEINGHYTVIAIANAAMYGYNFTIAPEAELTDGKFDVVMIKKASLFRYLLSSWRLLNNSLHKSRLVSIYKSEHVEIIPKQKDFFHLDGEGYNSPQNLRFDMHPKSIDVVFPQSYTVR